MKRMETNQKLIKTQGKTEKLIKIECVLEAGVGGGSGPLPFNFISFSVFP